MVANTRTAPRTPPMYPPGADQRDDREQYAARRAYAYELGERAALQRVISAEAYLFLFKELVRLCKDRTYCWAGVAWMTERLGVSEGTIKRWLRQLVDAGLIERTPRPGGDTALTRIPALIAYDAQVRQAQMLEQHPGPPQAVPPRAMAAEHPPTQPLFFVPAEGITDESHSDSDLISPSVKKLKRISGMVGGMGTITRHNDDRCRVEPGNVRPLTTIGVCGPGILDELRTYPSDEIAAICRYVERQRNSYNPAGLAVFLARSGFGRSLLRPKQGTGVVQSRPTPELVAPAGRTAHVPAEQRDLRLVTLWTQVQAQLAQQIPPHEFITWVQETQLVALDDARAVVGVPTIFAREQVQAVYAQQMGDVLTELTGKRVTVEVVIDHGG